MIDDILKLLNEGTTDIVQIYRTVGGQQPAAVNTQARVTSPTDSSGFLFMGIVAILLLFIVFIQK